MSGTLLDLHAYLGEYDPFGLKPLADEWEARGVGWIIGVGSDLPTSEAAVDAAWSLPNTIAGVGLHPSRLPANGEASAADLEELAALAELATDPQVAVISDVGVDDSAAAPLQLQEQVFRAALDIALANARSVLVDWRAPIARLTNFWDDLEQRPRTAVLGFSGDVSEAQALVDRGFWFSISPESVALAEGAATSPEVLTLLPAERLFIHSSARPGGSPAVVRDVLERLAAERGVDVDGLAAQINNNLWDFLVWRPK